MQFFLLPSTARPWLQMNCKNCIISMKWKKIDVKFLSASKANTKKTCRWTLEMSLFYVPAPICLLITGFCHLSRSRNEEKCRVEMLRRNVTARHGIMGNWVWWMLIVERPKKVLRKCIWVSFAIALATGWTYLLVHRMSSRTVFASMMSFASTQVLRSQSFVMQSECITIMTVKNRNSSRCLLMSWLSLSSMWLIAI